MEPRVEMNELPQLKEKLAILKEILVCVCLALVCLRSCDSGRKADDALDEVMKLRAVVQENEESPTGRSNYERARNSSDQKTRPETEEERSAAVFGE